MSRFVTAPAMPMFSVAANAAATFQWRFNGVDIDQVGDSNYSGADTDTLTVLDASIATQGVYDCIVFNAFGSVTSSTAVLGVDGATSGGDADGNGTIDVNDITFIIPRLGDDCP